MKTDYLQQIKDIILNTSHWNGGHGFIVPKSIGKILRQMGIKKGYSVNKDVKLK